MVVDAPTTAPEPTATSQAVAASEPGPEVSKDEAVAADAALSDQAVTPPEPVPASAERAALPSVPSRLAELFQLSVDERRVLTHLLGASKPARVGKVAAALEIELAALLTLLAGDAPLRAHGLVEVDEAAELGFLRPMDFLYPARGLHLIGSPAIAEAALFSGQAPGVAYLAAPPPGTEWAKDLLQDRSLTQWAQGPQASQVIELVRERLIATHPVLLWLSQCAPETVAPLCHAARLRLQRPVLAIDAAALAGWPTPQLFATLRRLRRDADLRGAAVVVSEAQLLGGAWQALALPRPLGQTAPVVLCCGTALAPLGLPPPSGRGGVEFVPQVATLRLPAAVATTVGTAGAAASAADVEDPATLASRDDARRRAAMDAARAMGKPIPPELMNVAPPAPPAPTPAPRPAAAPAAPAAPAAAAPATPAPAAPARPTNPRLAAALAKAGLAPAGGGAERPDASPRGTTPTATAPFTPRPPQPGSMQAAAPPAPVPVTSPPAEVSAAAAPTDVEVPADDQPPVPIADDAGPEELVRVARITPNQVQRAELLRKLSGKKSPQVIQLFRANTQSSHPLVRAAAEDGMSSIFGANWNRTRAIPPPVQPPRSDDGGRGPGGAF